jgi:hypothetical protein
MQITDLTVAEIDYRTALISWGTTKPSSSKINFSTSEDDLYNEKMNEEQTTSHSIRLEGDDLLAGKQYFFRVSAVEGDEAVTLDDSFYTKPVSVIIKVVDTKDEPVVEATVQAGDAEGITNESGEVTMDLPEGDVTIFAQKDELSKEISETIEVPTDENAPRFTLALSKTAAAVKVTVPQKKNTPWLLIVLPVIFVAAGVGGFLFWRRRNIQKASAYYGDPLEAENYTNEVMPSTPAEALPQTVAPEQRPEPQRATNPVIPIIPSNPEPTYLPVEDPRIPHHATLPEMLGRYGTEAAETDQNTGPVEPTSPTGQHIPKHVSLKELVETPSVVAEPNEPAPDVTDLPASPVSDAASSEPKDEPPRQNNGSLTIEH